MPIIKLDMNFCRSMGDVAKHPDHLSPMRPPERGPLIRLQAAWLVLTGKADALLWPDGK